MSQSESNKIFVFNQLQSLPVTINSSKSHGFDFVPKNMTLYEDF